MWADLHVSSLLSGCQRTRLSLPARVELFNDWSYKPCVKIVTELWHAGDPQKKHSHMYSVGDGACLGWGQRCEVQMQGAGLWKASIWPAQSWT